MARVPRFRDMRPVTLTDMEAEVIKYYAKRAESSGDRRVLWTILDRAGLGRGYTLIHPTKPGEML